MSGPTCPMSDPMPEYSDATVRSLRDQVAARTALVAELAHELRSPLTTVVGFAELLRAAPLTDECRGWSELILRSARQAVGLLDDTLDLFRLGVGDLSVSIEPVPLDTVLSGAVELTRAAGASRGVSVQSRLGKIAGRSVLADRQRLHQVIVSLLANAVGRSRDGGTATLAVEVTDDNRVRIEIRDGSPAPTEAEMDQLFMSIAPTEAELLDPKGPSLSLVLSRHLAEHMGGRFAVGASDDGGTVFSLEFPSVEPVDGDDIQADLEAIETRAYASTKKILYVEDLVTNIRLVAEILKRRPSVTLIPALVGRLAVELARERRPDLVLLDLHLPGLGGEEIFERLRADPETKDIPVVILSAEATRAPSDRMLAAGAVARLTKPVRVTDLLAIVDQALEAVDR